MEPLNGSKDVNNRVNFNHTSQNDLDIDRVFDVFKRTESLVKSTFLS